MYNLDAAIACATNQSWLGFTTAGLMQTLYIDEDCPVTETMRRIERLCKGRGFDYRTEKDFLNNFHLSPMCGVKVDSKEHFESIEDTLADHKIAMVFIDALVAVHDKDENLNIEMRGVMRDRLRVLMRKGKVGMEVMHHVSRPHKDAPVTNALKSRGATEILNASDQACLFEQEDENLSGTLTMCRSRVLARPWPKKMKVVMLDVEDATICVSGTTGSGAGKAFETTCKIAQLGINRLSVRDAQERLQKDGLEVSIGTVQTGMLPFSRLNTRKKSASA